MSCLFKCPYCKAAIKKRKVSGGPVACQVCLRIFEECHTEVQGLFVELLHDVPFSVVTPDLNERRDTQKAALAPNDPSSRSSGFVTAFSAASLELSPLFTTTSSSISGHLAELERLLGDSLYSAGEGPCSPGTTDILRAYFQILEVASILALDRDRADHAVHLFRKCLAANSLRNRNVEALATACLVHAMREAQEPRTLQKVAAAAGLPQKEVGKHLKVLADVLKLSQPVNSNSIAVHLPRFCASLQLDKTTQDLAAHIGEVVISKSFCTRRNPISISAAAIYLSCQLEDKRKTQTEICKATGLTEVTLRKVYKELLENLDDLLPPNYRPPVPLERAFPVTAAALGRVTASRNTSTNAPLCSPESHAATVPSLTGPLVTVPSQDAAQLPPLPRRWSSPPSSMPPTNQCADPELPEGVNRSAGKGIDPAVVVTPVPTFRSGEGSAFLARVQGPGIRNGRTFSGVGPPPCFTGGSRQQQSGEGDGQPLSRKGGEFEREDRQRESHEAEEERWRARERDGVLKEQEAHADRCRGSCAMHPSPTGTSGGGTSFENSFFPYQGMGAPRMMDPRLAHAWAAANHHRMFGGFHPAVGSAPMSAAEANRQEVEARDVGEGGPAKGAPDIGAGTGRTAAMAEGSGIQPASMASASRGLAPGEGMGPFPWMGLPPPGVAGSLQRDQEKCRAGVRDRAAEIAGKEGGGAQPSEKLGQAGKSEGFHAQNLGETPGHRQSQDNDLWGRFRSGQGSGPETGSMPPGFVPAFQGFPPQFWQMVAGASSRFPMFPPPYLPPEFARSMAAGGGASTVKRDGDEEKGENAGRSDGGAAWLGPRQAEAEGNGRSSTAWSPKDGRSSQVPQSPMMMPPMPFPHLFMPQASRLGLGDGPGLGDKGRPENTGQPENSRACGTGLGAGFHPMLSFMALQQMYGPHMAAMARPSFMEGPRVAEVGGESNGAVEHKAPP